MEGSNRSFPKEEVSSQDNNITTATVTTVTTATTTRRKKKTKNNKKKGRGRGSLVKAQKVIGSKYTGVQYPLLMLSVQFPPLKGPNSFVTSPADQPGISAKSEGASGSAVRKIVNYKESLCSNCVQGIENDSKNLGDIFHLHPSVILFCQNYPNLLSSSSLSSPYPYPLFVSLRF